MPDWMIVWPDGFAVPLTLTDGLVMRPEDWTRALVTLDRYAEMGATLLRLTRRSSSSLPVLVEAALLHLVEGEAARAAPWPSWQRTGRVTRCSTPTPNGRCRPCSPSSAAYSDAAAPPMRSGDVTCPTRRPTP